MVPQNRISPDACWTLLIAVLWAQVFYCASYSWLYGEYYDYGWYVPPLAAWFFYRKWRTWKILRRPPLPGWQIAGGAVSLTLILVCVRILGRTDPAWTMPLWCLAGTACATTLFVVWRIAGKTALPGLVPVLLFALTAVRLPAQIEHGMVDLLTHGVLASSSGVFHLLGREVAVVGNQLELMGEVVEVTEGCSGIRSAQSFLMASLCFGEWLGLNVRSRFQILGIGFGAAWVMNVARACVLAEIRFNQGESSFHKAHDLVGLVAFVVGTGLLLAAAFLMDSKRSRGRTIRQKVESRHA